MDIGCCLKTFASPKAVPWGKVEWNLILEVIGARRYMRYYETLGGPSRVRALAVFRGVTESDR